MTIQEEDFRMILGGGNLWDLELTKVVRPKGGEPRVEFKPEGYGMPLESCIKRIINKRISDKKETLSLKEYVEEYKQQVDELKKLFNQM